MTELSIVIPAYNEAKNVSLLYEQLKPVLVGLGKTCEIIFIDDGSKDNTFLNLLELHEKDKNVKIIKFRKNYGQTAALSAGFKLASGKIIITMDSDLQNDPRDIPRLLEKLNQGYDLVSGWRYKRKDPFSKKLFSKLSNFLAKKLINVRIHDSGCSLKAYRREAVKGLELYGEMHRFIPALIAMNGFSIGEVKVAHHMRRFGRTKYDLARLMKGFLDLLYVKFWKDYSTRPIHFFGLFGILLYILSLLVFVEQIIKALIVKELILGPLLMLAVLFTILATQFIFFGFLGEILVRTYYSGSDKESFVIERIVK